MTEIYLIKGNLKEARLIRARAPCYKGELRLPLITIIWKRS